MKEKLLKKGFTRNLLCMMLAFVMMLTLLPMNSIKVNAEEIAGRGETWDILYSEVRANGAGKAYPVGTRIYIDINPKAAGTNVDFFFIDSYDAAVNYGYITGNMDENYGDHYCPINVDVGAIVSLESTYACPTGFCPGDIISGGYWIFNPDNGQGDEFFGVASSGNGGSFVPTDVFGGNNGHKHSYATSWSKDANKHWHECTAAGTCDAQKKDEAAHSWNNGVVTKEPTYTAAGVMTYTCSVCGQTKTEDVAQLQHKHSYATSWSKDANKHWHECTAAGTCDAQKKDEAAHSWNNGVVTKEPTYTAEGVKTYTCTTCKATKTERLPKKTKTPTDKTPTDVEVKPTAKNLAETSINSKFKVSQADRKLYVNWGKVTGATKYEVYANYCGSKMKLQLTTTDTKAVITKLNGSSLNRKKEYKVYVVAKKGNEIIATSIAAHVAGEFNTKYTNPVLVTPIQKTMTLKVGKTGKADATIKLNKPAKKAISHVAKLRFKSSNYRVATVDAKGTVKGLRAGKATIYMFAHNAIVGKVEVTVK